MSQFPKTALLVSILSPRYLKSEWCLKEIEEFCKAAEIHGGLVIGNKMRVHRVMLMPLAADLREKLPGKLKQELGYPFYKEQEGGRFQRLDPRFGDEFKAAFNLKVASMADELAEIIEKLKEEENPIPEPMPAKPAGPPKPVIYLAECSWDRGDDREKIRSELRATGYTVLPDQGTRLPDMEVEYVAEVESIAGPVSAFYSRGGCKRRHGAQWTRAERLGAITERDRGPEERGAGFIPPDMVADC